MFRKVVIAALAASALAGCGSFVNGRDQALSVAEEHPISVDSQIVTLTVGVDGPSGLSSVDRARVRAFADAYLASGHGPMTITTPSGSAADLSAQDAASDARAELDASGVDAARIQSASYRSGEEKREMILSYTRFVATPSACGDWSGDMMRDFRNLTAKNYGCATQNNLAAMVADPHDLVEPAALSPSDPNARRRMLDAYRRGEKTSTQLDEDAKAEVKN